MNWQSLITSIIGGLVVVLTGLLIKAWDTRKSQKDNALYAAIVLEDWSMRCARIKWDTEYHNSTGRGEPPNTLPALVNIKEEIVLEAIPLRIRGQILELYSKIEFRNKDISQQISSSGKNVCADFAIEFGSKALVISNEIRKKCGVKRGHDEEFESACNTLMTEYEKLMKLNAQRKADMAELKKQIDAQHEETMALIRRVGLST